MNTEAKHELREQERFSFTDTERRTALNHAKTLVARTETVFTDGQGTWYGARLDNHPTTPAFEVCPVCLQINAHEDECGEGYQPLAAAQE